MCQLHEKAIWFGNQASVCQDMWCMLVVLVDENQSRQPALQKQCPWGNRTRMAASIITLLPLVSIPVVELNALRACRGYADLRLPMVSTSPWALTTENLLKFE